jgi:hypothetical protein
MGKLLAEKYKKNVDIGKIPDEAVMKGGVVGKSILFMVHFDWS